MIKPIVAYAAGLATLLGCNGNGQPDASGRANLTEQGQLVRQSTTSVCDGADSLIFSNVVTDSETEDLSGEEIVLRRRGLDWSGSSRVAAGEFLGRLPLVAVTASSVPGPVSFSIPDGADTSVFQGKIFCDSLAGELREFGNSPFQHMTYNRIRR